MLWSLLVWWSDGDMLVCLTDVLRIGLYVSYVRSILHTPHPHPVILIQYMLCLFDITYFILALGKAVESTRTSTPSTPWTPVRNQRWRRRHRHRKPPYYKRKQRKRYNNQGEKSTGTRSPRWNDAHDLGWTIMSSITPYWRYLHILGDSFGSDFMDLCSCNPDIIQLFGADWRFKLGTTHPYENCMFLRTDVMVDLTSIRETGDVFRFQSVYHTKPSGEKLPIIFDSGASISITPKKDDFVHLNKNTTGTTLSGITSTATCQGRGTVKFTVLDDNGIEKEIITQALYVPEAKVRLLSVQRYCLNVKNGAQFTVNESGCTFKFPTTQGGGRLTFDLESNNMLPQTSEAKQWGRKLINSR